MIDGLAKWYPNVAFILGHSGGTCQGREEAEQMGEKHRYVYLEWCGSFCSAHSWINIINIVGPRKIVFGTDAMPHSIYWELGRLLSLDVPDSVIRPILGENMRRILAQRRPWCLASLQDFAFAGTLTQLNSVFYSCIIMNGRILLTLIYAANIHVIYIAFSVLPASKLFCRGVIAGPKPVGQLAYCCR